MVVQDVKVPKVETYILHITTSIIIYILINILYLHCIFLSGCDLEQLNCIASSTGSIISAGDPTPCGLAFSHLPRPRRHESGKLKMNRRNWCRVLRESP